MGIDGLDPPKANLDNLSSHQVKLLTFRFHIAKLMK